MYFSPWLILLQSVGFRVPALACHAESPSIISRLHIDGNIADADKVSYAQKDFHQMVKHVEMCLHARIAVGGARQMYIKASYRKRMMIGFFTNTLPKLLGVMVMSYTPYAFLSCRHTDKPGTDYVVDLYNDLGFNGELV
ncbi:hypothetical protein BDR06DRAFT_766713 [Suillus hirtellus]|nr:hypothetical protein BDR06DRAFT_766713 [Suillus hirtellus]